jgi:hypothetical protein
MVPEKKDDVLCPQPIVFFCVVWNLFLKLILYIMLALPSLMNKNNFWTSGLRLLTTDWQNPFFPFNEYDILLSQEQAQIPVICVKRRQRKGGQMAGGREFVGD